MGHSAFCFGAADQTVLRPSILVVDDDPDIRTVLRVALEIEGFRVVTAGNGAEALQQLERERPAVILLDMMMPVMSGPQFRQEQLRRVEYSAIPVVCMSAVHDGWPRQDHPTVAFLRKPFDVEELVRIISTICRRAPTAGF